MSSNIRIEKKCEYCEKKFIAKTIHTRYCSHSCNSKDYKLQKRIQKIKVAEKHPKLTKLIHSGSLIDTSPLNNKIYFDLKEAALYLNISTATIRLWIKNAIMPSSKIGKKYIIRRLDIEALIERKMIR